MKCVLVAFLVIASVAAGNLRASSKQENDSVNTFVEMKDKPSTNRKFQMGMETTGMEEATQMIDDTQDTSRNLKPLRHKATLMGRDTPAFDIHKKDVSNVDAISNINARIVGGDVSDPNEFPYFGTSVHLPVRIKCR